MNDVLWWAAQNAVAMALLVPVVWLVARLRRSRPAEQHLLWLLLLVKLLTPPVVLWPWSTEEIREWVTTHENGASHETPSASVTVGSPIDVGEVVALDPLPVMPADLAEVVAFGPVILPDEPVATDPSPTVARRPIAASRIFVSASQIAVLLWLGGAIAVCLRIGVHIRTQLLIVRTAREAPPELRSLVEAVSSRLGIGRVAAKVSARTATPFVSCLGRPVLVWPEALANGDSIAACEGVVAHELAHIRRRDHWVAWLEAIAAPLWWWNPVFWYVRRRLDETRELACDAVALEGTTSDRRAFAELLLTFSASGRPALPFAPLRTGIAPRHSLRRRLAMLFDKRVSGRVSPAGITLSLLLAAVALPGWAWSQEEPSEPASPSEDVAPVAPATVPAAEDQPTPPVRPRPATVPMAPAAPPAGRPAAPETVPRSPDAPAVAAPDGTPSPKTHRIEIDGERVLLLRRANEGGGLIIQFVEDDQPGATILVEDDFVLPDGRTFQWKVNALPGFPGILGALDPPADPMSEPDDDIYTKTGWAGIRTGRRPARQANHSATEVRLLKNALQLALLEAEQKKVLLEQAREENKRQHALFETGATNERPRDLRLLEIELKKAELQAEQARIRLEAAEAGWGADALPPEHRR